MSLDRRMGFISHEGLTMRQALIRHLRLFCQSPDATPVRHHDGILAVAGVLERANLARLLLVDMERFGRNRGASVTNAIQRVAPAAHRLLIGGFGIALVDTLVVEVDRSGAFDLVCDLGDGRGSRHQPLFCMHRKAPARSREAFLSWAGEMGRAMLDRAEAVGAGEWVGVEG